MKGRDAMRSAAAGALCLALSGCFGPGGSWRIPSFMRPAPSPPAESHLNQPSAGGEINGSAPAGKNEKHARRTRPRHPADSVEQTSEEPASETPAAPPAAPAPAVEPQPKPTITLAGGPSKARAEQLLDDAGAKLSKINRSTLGADSTTTYDQANNFLQAGRRAATEDDYVAASGFAEKAAVLAAKLVPASP
jgi:hypothetical protein